MWKKNLKDSECMFPVKTFSYFTEKGMGVSQNSMVPCYDNLTHTNVHTPPLNVLFS